MGTAHVHHPRTSSRNSRRTVEPIKDHENGVSAAPVVVANGITKVPSTNYASSYGDERTVKKLRLSKALTIPEELTVADACRRMAHRRVGAVMLSDLNGLLSGIITDKDIAVRVVADGLDPEHTLVSKIMTRNPVFVTMDTHAIDALQEMVRGKFRHLPVVENGEAIAILDITKCLYDAISRMEKAAEQGSAIAAAVEGVERQWGGDLSAHYAFIETLRERMFKPSLSSIAENTPIELVAPSDSVYLAAKKMKENHATAVIVMIGGKPQGILTSRDVLMRVVARNLSPEHVAVEKIMTAHPECATMDTKILDALHIMQEGKFLHLPIVDHGGSIIACVNVLQVTHAAISLVDGGSELVDDMATSMIQKFWDSTLALELPDEQIETQSERSTSMISENSGETCKYMHPSLVDANTFVFKYEDHEGHMHRFSCGTKSIRALRAAVMDRVLPEHYEYNALLMYIDDEGDKVLLETNGDLADAINHARSARWKVIRLQLEKSVKEETTSNSAETQRGGMTSLHVSILTGVVLIAGISVIVYLRRSNL